MLFYKVENEVEAYSLFLLYFFQTKWSISIPFELMFLNAGTEVKEPVLGSKVKSDGMVNPFVLKAEVIIRRSSHQYRLWVEVYRGLIKCGDMLRGVSRDCVVHCNVN